jgi:hypothetical protein
MVSGECCLSSSNSPMHQALAAIPRRHRVLL